MKRLIPIIVLLFIGCATVPPGSYKVVKRTVTTDGQGQVLYIQEEQEPVVKFNFWSTLIDVTVGAGKKAGGL